MSIFEHSRFKIFNTGQHPLRHSLSDFLYSNERLPGVTTPEDALNYLVAIMYPNYIGTYATPADLPLAASANDYAIVSNDGDGKSAGYIWVSNDGVSQWMKRYDVDWSMEDILAEAVNVTQPMYVKRDGFNDLDAAGTPVAGTYAGQKVYGGTSTNTNLTFNANSADNTGYVQTDNHFRPTANNTIDLGTVANNFRSAYVGTDAKVSTLNFSTGSITDSTGSIDFGNENLSTTGLVSSNTLDVAVSADVGTLHLADGSITDSSGAISFGNENLTTTGTITGAVSSKLGTITFGTGTISADADEIDFGNDALVTTGTLEVGDATLTKADVDNVRVDGNTISVINLNGSLNLDANGTGVVDIGSNATTLNITATGDISATGFVSGGNLKLSGNTLSSTDANGDITLDPNGSGSIVPSASVIPAADNTHAIGSSVLRFSNLFLSGSIGDGTTTISQSTLQSLRDINSGVAAGMTIFWDGAKWVPSVPDSEVTHGSLSGLTTGDAGHTQFTVLAGRAGGQTVQGGTAASENLTLESTAHATKGSVLTKDNLKPFTNASYSGSWSGTDLGSASNAFRDVYTKGELKGARVENFTFAGLPSAAASSIGRVAYTTDTNKLYVDNGTAWKVAGSSKYVTDTSWNGSDLTKTVTVSDVSDARNCLIQLLDNSNNFERIYTKIEALNATDVRITTNVALPAGSYRLILME